MNTIQTLFRVLLIWNLILTILVGLLGWAVCEKKSYYSGGKLELIKTPVPTLLEVKVDGNSFKIKE
jgi:hypothetical protein